jgi:hypothetical protein
MALDITRASAGRGQTEVLGAVLVFGLVVALLVTLQLYAVPSANARVEFDHSLRTQASMQELSSATLAAAVRDREEVVTVEYGTRYPSRLFLLNPPPASGSLRTVDLGPVVLRNVRADGEALDHLDGSTHVFESRAVEYRPDYAAYHEAPTTVYEYPVTYSRFATAERVLDGGELVSGDRITLVTLEGDVAASRVGPAPVHLVPVSAATRPIAVTDDGVDPIRIELPTRLSNETWRTVLADEYVSAGGSIAAQTYVDGVDGGPGTLVLEFETGRSYRLRIARVAVGEAPTGPEPSHYLAEGHGDHTALRLGEESLVSVEVRDRYNNPVTGAPVVATPGAGTLGELTPRAGGATAFSDDEGRAWFTYRAPATGVAGVAADAFDITLDGASGDAARIPFTVELRGSKAGGGGGDGGTDGTDGAPTFHTLSATADDVDTSPPSVEQVTLEYDTSAALPIYEVTVLVEHVPAPPSSAVTTVADRGSLPATGQETLGLQVHGNGNSNSWNLQGQPALRVTVTAVDTVGETVTCVGTIADPDETITLTSATDGGVPFACTPAAEEGG